MNEIRGKQLLNWEWSVFSPQCQQNGPLPQSQLISLPHNLSVLVTWPGP